VNHEEAMRAAIAEGELARGSMGDNPWVGSVIVFDGAIVARGRTQGPGEDHAEIGALREARARGIELSGVTLYSTLEPCAFHGRTPACARVIAESGVRTLVVGIRDPHPRVDGAGLAIVRAAGVDVVDEVCARAIRQQLAPWITHYHPHEPARRARELARPFEETAEWLADFYGLAPETAQALARIALGR
jgi:diaminohydroxyphosphoribosylaminopyrimidine deaminase/5-amino-6-(5-phosphoribosylamino)uracil reductase